MSERKTKSDAGVPAVETGADLPTRRTIGRYRIKGLIGAGGMGRVYAAVQEEPRRTVALKVMNPGIAARSALRRFELEAQTLARLRHPGIAQIYEAGTYDEGSGPVPYFAMEYVAGAKSITEYAAGRNLGMRDRLELFTRVCDAVHHGHQKGIIHRDLKPSNILVDSSGDPKIIDFGVARATDSDMVVTTLQTDVGQLIGTLQYMSPEQCDADPDGLDTRSDVYALGLVLFELLCRQPPYDVAQVALHEAARVIREEPPDKPSAIDPTLRGDVETITLKAIEKEPERRYQSAADLGRDIERYLNSEPIEARPSSALYHLRLLATRHWGLTIGAMIAVGMSALTATALVMSIIMILFSLQMSERHARVSHAAMTYAKALLPAPEAETSAAELHDRLDEAQRQLVSHSGSDRAIAQLFLADANLTAERAADAEVLFSDSERWLANVFGQDDPLTSTARWGLARSVAALHKHDEAAQIYRELLNADVAQRIAVFRSLIPNPVTSELIIADLTDELSRNDTCAECAHPPPTSSGKD